MKVTPVSTRCAALLFIDRSIYLSTIALRTYGSSLSLSYLTDTRVKCPFLNSTVLPYRPLMTDPTLLVIVFRKWFFISQVAMITVDCTHQRTEQESRKVSNHTKHRVESRARAGSWEWKMSKSTGERR